MAQFTEVQLFDMFYIDMGASLFPESFIGPLSKKQMKLLGKPLWEVRSKRQARFETKNTPDDMRRKAKAERKKRSREIASIMSANQYDDDGELISGITVESAIAQLPQPKYTGWQE